MDKKLERWQKIVQEASQQCKRTQRPQVCAPIELADAGAWRSEQNFVAYEDEALHGGLLSAQLEKGRSVTLVIGPEGGFSPAEIERLQTQLLLAGQADSAGGNSRSCGGLSGWSRDGGLNDESEND